MHADIEHPGWEQAGLIHAHRGRPAVAELHVAVLAALLGLLRTPQRIARPAPAHVLDEARVGRHNGAAIGHAAAAHRPLAENIVLHVRQDVAVVLVLVMVGVHVDDDNVVELALDRLLAGMGEKPGGVQLVDRYASAAPFAILLAGFASARAGILFAAGCAARRVVLAALGEDINLIPFLDDFVFAELEFAVGHAFAGLHVVFVAVPGTYEMHFAVREVEPLRGLVG